MTLRVPTRRAFTFALLVSLTLAAPRAQQTRPNYGSTTTAVLVDVVVRDQHHRPVPALPADDFELFEDDVRQPLGKYAVFICPILSGSGVRVKLLEAFAAGIPVVSTHVGAEGLARNDGEFCRLADDPAGFADRIAALLDDPKAAGEMARRARAEVEANWDMAAITGRLVDGYREMIRMKRVAEATSSSAVPYPSSAD